jgi:hypothetical protein
VIDDLEMADLVPDGRSRRIGSSPGGSRQLKLSAPDREQLPYRVRCPGIVRA